MKSSPSQLFDIDADDVPYIEFGSYATPAEPKAEAFADSLVTMLQTRLNLQAAKANVPYYTGQWEAKDYVRNEQEAYNRAIDKLAEATKALLQQ